MMDLHCHVDLYPDHKAILDDIKQSNYYVLSVTTVPSAWVGTVKLTEGLSHCKTALGLHPQLAHQRKNELTLFDKLVCETRYIGEIGLDGSRGYKEYLDDQLFVLNHILKKCESYGDKILTIHSLNAVEQTLNCLKEHPNAGKPILHWFLGTKKQVIDATELGCFFSIGPAMLNSARGRKVISWIPQDRVLLETDGPFAKINGEILFPSNVDMVIGYLSQCLNMPKQEVMEQLASNLRSIVSK
jgi:TatD DNase family protein